MAGFDLVGTSIQPQSADGPDVLIKSSGSSGGSGLDPKSVELRAERLGEDRAGRIYNLLATATDAAGNKTTANAVCVVPHDQR